MTRKITSRKFFLVAQIIFLALICVSCDGDKGKNQNQEFSPIINQTIDYEFSFNTNLAEEKPIYPLSEGRVFYVSSEGDDENDGLSETTALKTITAVNQLDLLPGDSILFKKGDSFEGELQFENLRGSDENPITFASYGQADSKPILTANSTVILFEKCDNIVVRDLQINVNGVDYSENSDPISGIHFSYPYVGNTKYKNVFICDNTVLGNGVNKNIVGIVIDGLEGTVASSPSEVLTTCYVTGNNVSNIGRSGIKSSGWLVKEKVNQNQTKLDYYQDFHFDNNVVHDVGCMGIYIAACTNSTINRNLVYNTGLIDQTAIQEGECGIMAIGTDNCKIMFNECYNIYDSNTGNDAMGIDIDWNTNNVLVQYNYLHDCQGSGVGTMANQNSYILNNRIENNQCATNHKASIHVTNYTSKYDAVDPTWHSVKNLLIGNNLIIHNQADKNVFRVEHKNGDIEFEGNEFFNNHCVYNEEDVSSFKWVYVDTNLAWYKFASNKWYSKDTSRFTCFEMTDYTLINFEDGALPYESAAKKRFSDWAKRDVGATYETLNDEVAANPHSLNLQYEDGNLVFDWKVNEGDIWHFNIYEVGENEEVGYRNMIGEAYDTCFTYTPTTKGVRYFIIQPESNQGVYGKAIKVKVSL